MLNVQTVTASRTGDSATPATNDPTEALKTKIAYINRNFAGVPEERDRRITEALIDWAGPLPEPEAPNARVEIDPVTGHKYVDMSSVQNPNAENDRALQYWKMGQASVLTPHSLEESERRDGLGKLTKMGGNIPPLIDKANQMIAAISAIRTEVPPLKVDDLPSDPAGIEAAVTEYVNRKMRAEAARGEYQRISAELTGQFVDACRQSVSDVLSDPKVRETFTKAAKQFTENYPTVSDCHTLEDAARKDQTGQAVGAWHKVQAAKSDLDAVVDVVVHFATPKRATIQAYPPSRRINPSALLGISAEPAPLPGVYLSELASHGIDGADIRLDSAHVFGVYGAQLDAGCTLSLPKDLSELNDRANDFDPRGFAA